MSLRKKITEIFWVERETSPRSSRHLFNYRRIWKVVVFLTGSVSLLPLIFITMVDYHVTQNAMESEFRLRTARLVSNMGRSIAFFISERRSALDFIAHDRSDEAMDPVRLGIILENLKRSFGGGFVDLGIINEQGVQVNYVGPEDLVGKGYSGQEWYERVVANGVYISDVFMGYRQTPHVVIAVKGSSEEGPSFVLRSSIYLDPFESLLGHLEVGGGGDAFIINHKGILQTSSRIYGDILGKIPLAVPAFSPKTEVMEVVDPRGRNLLVGYRFIENTPFVVMVVKNKKDLMEVWFSTRLLLIGFLIASVSIILGVIAATAAYMVKKMRIADEQRLMSFHKLEYSNKLASIGRLAAGVAHEINNPLAIINEKAGLIRDLFTIRKQYAGDDKLMGLIDSVLKSVNRAGAITKRLLTFAKNFDASVETLNLGQVVEEVLGFMRKDAEHRSINITVDVPLETPAVESDRGKLQQIFLNIINNAFIAMSDGGHLKISVRRKDKDHLIVNISDDGCGIRKEDLDHIFEPFFSTRVKQGGTGLGLSITYGLVQELGGNIEVQSEVGKGTTFFVTLPLRPPQDRR
ncbi:MAG: sensor histidine kinase [Desulfobacteraceae bacterium]|jgi:signal transduction histidine kinase|nr:MAG: sensor histidine kinase [Desulfobacteraceae bacterium]